MQSAWYCAFSFNLDCTPRASRRHLHVLRRLSNLDPTGGTLTGKGGDRIVIDGPALKTARGTCHSQQQF